MCLSKMFIVILLISGCNHIDLQNNVPDCIGNFQEQTILCKSLKSCFDLAMLVMATHFDLAMVRTININYGSAVSGPHMGL